MEYETKIKEAIDRLRLFGYTDKQIKEMLANLFIKSGSKEREEEPNVR